jgi:hypothetical protein
MLPDIEAYENTYKMKNVEPNEFQKRKIKALQKGAEYIVSVLNSKENPILNNGDIYGSRVELYIDTHKNQMEILGMKQDDLVWLSFETLNKDYMGALNIYLHELCHRHGGDGDKDFTYALTSLNEAILLHLNNSESFSASTENSSAYAAFLEAKKMWSQEK